MHHTFTLNVDPVMARFIDNYPGQLDPSELINRLYRNEMKRVGFHAEAEIQTVKNDPQVQALEDFADENTPAAG